MPEKTKENSELNIKDPYRAYNFKLLIGEITEGHFMECSGMDIRINTIAYRETGPADGPGNPGYLRKIPGPVEYGDIVLKYGLTDSDTLWNWFMTGVEGNIERKNITIQLLDSAGSNVVMQWDLIGAWASQWKGAHLDAMGREIAIESLTIVYENLIRSGGGGGGGK
ncbi:MAG: phage tail protein [Desulfobacteraceae bacterium]|nr:phage tail protein [Desulfobacteraceae bacterium]